MGLDFSQADAILKDDYLPPIRDLLNNKHLLMKRIQRNTEDFVGRQGYIPLKVGRNEGIGNRAEGGTLPRAGNQKYSKALFGMCYIYGQIEVSGPIIAAMGEDDGAFTRAVDSEVKELVPDVCNDINRQMFGEGTSELAKSSGSSSGTTITCSSSHYWGSIKHLREGMRVDFVNATNGNFVANGENRTVVSVDVDAGTFVVDVGPTCTSDTVVVRQGNYGFNDDDPQTARELWGLGICIDDGAATAPAVAGTTLKMGNITRSATTPWWKANVVSGASGLTFDLMEQVVDKCETNGNGNTSLIVTDHAQHRAYGALLVPDRRFVSADGMPHETLDGGFKALEFDGIPVVKDKDAPSKRMWFLDETSFMLFEQSDFEWMDKDGSILNRITGKDAYGATLYKYCQMGCGAPRKNGVIEGLPG